MAKSIRPRASVRNADRLPGSMLSETLMCRDA